MSDTFYRRLNLAFGFLVLGAIFAMQTFVANIEIKDLDLWLHIGTGRFIVENGFHVPGVDFLSCTIAGHPWVNHEWLFQVIVYYIYQAAGPNGLILMQVILSGITGMILFLLGYNRKRQFLCLLSFLFVCLIYQMRFTIRPDLFSLLFFVCYVLVLSFFLERRWSSVVLFVVQVLWTNMHGFFFFGPLFILLSLTGEFFKRHVPLPWEWNSVGRLSDEEYRRLKWLLGFTVLACLLNPLTFKGAWYPIGVLFQISGDSAIFFNHIMELKKPITMSSLWSMAQYPYYKILILISAMSFFFNRWKIDLTALLFWSVFLLFSLAAIRNMAYFAFAAHLVFMANISSIDPRDVVPIRIKDNKFIDSIGLVFKVLLLVWILQYIISASGHGYFDFDRYERKSEFGGVSQRNFPEHAVNFLVDNHVRGNMFNEFNSGAYVVGRCFPDIKVYIDGRTEVYGPEFFKHYLKIVQKEDAEVLQEDLDRYDISIVLINTVREEGPEKILKYLYDQKDWALVYLGHDGLIFLKRIPLNAEVIAAHEIDPKAWTVRPMDEFRLGSRKVVPYQNINRAYSLEALGFPEAALKEARAALYVYPGYPAAFALIGEIYAQQDQISRAFHFFRLALTYNSDSRKIRGNMAKMYELMGQYDEALNQYETLTQRFPEHAEAYFLAARTLIKSGKPAAARQYIRAGFNLDQKTARDIIELGDLLMDQGRYADAVDTYAIALPGPRRQGELRLKLGDAFAKMGQPQRSKEEWTMAMTAAQTDEQREAITNRLEGLDFFQNKSSGESAEEPVDGQR